jgi:Protein of unknown function (DUF429)
MMRAMELWGVDFTCAPSARKPITVARGRMVGDARLQLDTLQALRTLTGFETLLAKPGPWSAAFDFPFGLPRIFVNELGLGLTTDEVIHTLHQRCPTRMEFRRLIDGWTNNRPPGQRLVHRATDRTRHGVSSTSPLQSRYVPVAFMYFEGLHRLVQADVHMPRLRTGRRGTCGLEGYPGLLAHELIGSRSYKNKDDGERLAARVDLIARLERGDHRLGVSLGLSVGQRRVLLDDVLGDHLDAVLCLVQAAWACVQRGHGMPRGVDPVEGWITSA